MPRPFRFTESQVRQMIDAYQTGWGTTEIPRRVDFACNPDQVKYALTKNDVQMRPFGLGRPQRSRPLSEPTRRMIDGMLLGDGHLVRIKPPLVNSGFAMQVSARQADFVAWVGSYFREDSIPFSTGEKPNSWVNTSAIQLSTAKTKEFTVLRNRWYPNDAKAIPADLELSPETIAAWHLGDGTRHKHAGITLSTNSFTQDDVTFLAMLFERISIKATVHRHARGANGFGAAGAVDWLLYIPRERGNLKRLFDFIGPCPVPSLRYKWPDL